MIAESGNIADYLKRTDIVDFDHPAVEELRRKLADGTGINPIVRIFEYVRDGIPHSSDIRAPEVPCSASEVLSTGHGICCAKSNLLAALLRGAGIPTGFCYQKLCYDADNDEKILHGLNAVYLPSPGRWIRLDARGNTNGVNARFDGSTETVAFPSQPERGEKDHPVIFVGPDPVVTELLRKSGTRDELWTVWPRALEALFPQ